VGAGIYDTSIKQEKNDYIPKNSTWIVDSVTEFVPTENKVTKSGKEISYQYLVVPRYPLDWDKIKGLKKPGGVKMQ
jgi:sulfide:quinone oxidoreductase